MQTKPHGKPALLDLIQDPSYTPRVKDVGALIDFLNTEDEDQQDAVQRAILRVGRPAISPILAGLSATRRPARGLLVKVLGRLGQVTQDPDVARSLLSYLDDADLKARRNAILALGHHPLPEVEPALLKKWAHEERIDHRRSLASSLGKIGGEASRQALASFRTDDPELKRIISQALVILSRNKTRVIESTIRTGVTPPRPIHITAYCRAGVEPILAAEADAAWRSRVLAPGKVLLTMRAPLEHAFRMRTMLRFAVALRPERGDALEATVRSITSAESLKILRQWTDGPIRYRIEWVGAGHRRGAVWACAKAVTERCPDLINDPTNSTWEALVEPRKSGAQVFLAPKKLADPRFEYRRRDVFASSHPTLAAALARLGGAEKDDVVWDPFCGSGTELIERALLGPYRALHGNDLDPKAIEAAKENAHAAAVKRAEWHVADALTTPVPGATLIMTNPPMGRRSKPGGVGPLLGRFIELVSHTLVKEGRFVWISPTPEQHAELAKKNGLRLTFKQTVDLGGFRGQIQRYIKPE